jgi:hypothetical protein
MRVRDVTSGASRTLANDGHDRRSLQWSRDGQAMCADASAPLKRERVLMWPFPRREGLISPFHDCTSAHCRPVGRAVSTD